MQISFSKTAPVVLATAALTLGCGYSRTSRTIDRQPEVDMGVGATVLMPGQGGPAMAPPPGYGAPVAAPPPGQYPNTYPQQAPPPQPYGQPPYSQAPSGGGVTMIGGAAQDMQGERVTKGRGLPIPLAIVAYPFKKAYDLAKGDDDPPPQQAPAGAAPAPQQSYRDPQLAHEQAQLEALDRAIQSQPPAPAPRQSSAAPPQSTASRSGSAPSSIAEELAALQRRRSPYAPGANPEARRSTAAPSGAPVDPTLPRSAASVADRVGDRNRDGRPDYWEYRDRGHLVRELFDENADGHADRTVHYDPASGLETREEEDTNFDGSVDSWVEYHEGKVQRRRSDANGDGEPDAWMFYRNGQIARHEQDMNGDGFRDRVGHYEGGQITREEADNDGDGRPDVVTYYDAQEQISKRDEDTDGDGTIDVRSFYEHGRLARREMLSEDALEELEPAGLRATSWDDGQEG